jgi:septal ring factor EnvC (AmiA/AmiB activator)
MNQLCPGPFARFAMAIAVSLLPVGCATSSDLEALKADLTKKLDAQTKNLRGETGKLHDQTHSLRTDMQTLRAQVSKLEPDIKRMLEVQNEQDVMRSLMVKEFTAALANNRKAIEGYGANMATLGLEVRSLNAAVRGSYELDEDALKSRLRTVEEMKKRLSPLETRQ